MMAETTTIATINNDPSRESIEGETVIKLRRGLRPQQTVIYRLKPEIGQWQEQGDQQLADRLQEEKRRAKRKKSIKSGRNRKRWIS